MHCIINTFFKNAFSWCVSSSSSLKVSIGEYVGGALHLSSGSLIGDDPAEDTYEGWYDGTGEVLLLGDEEGDLEYNGDRPKAALEDPEVPEEIRHYTLMRFGYFHSSLLFKIKFSYFCVDFNYFCKI